MIYVIDEANWAALIKYEARLPIIGTRYGSWGGVPLFGEIEAGLEVQLRPRCLDSSMLVSIKITRSNTQAFEEGIVSGSQSSKEAIPDSL